MCSVYTRFECFISIEGWCMALCAYAAQLEFTEHASNWSQTKWNWIVRKSRGPVPHFRLNRFPVSYARFRHMHVLLQCGKSEWPIFNISIQLYRAICVLAQQLVACAIELNFQQKQMIHLNPTNCNRIQWIYFSIVFRRNPVYTVIFIRWPWCIRIRHVYCIHTAMPTAKDDCQTCDGCCAKRKSSTWNALQFDICSRRARNTRQTS